MRENKVTLIDVDTEPETLQVEDLAPPHCPTCPDVLDCDWDYKLVHCVICDRETYFRPDSHRGSVKCSNVGWYKVDDKVSVQEAEAIQCVYCQKKVLEERQVHKFLANLSKEDKTLVRKIVRDAAVRLEKGESK